jgi:hypothetical protein
LFTGKSLLKWAVDNKRSSTVLELLNKYQPTSDCRDAPAFYPDTQQHFAGTEKYPEYEPSLLPGSEHLPRQGTNQTEGMKREAVEQDERLKWLHAQIQKMEQDMAGLLRKQGTVGQGAAASTAARGERDAEMEKLETGDENIPVQEQKVSCLLLSCPTLLNSNGIQSTQIEIKSDLDCCDERNRRTSICSHNLRRRGSGSTSFRQCRSLLGSSNSSRSTSSISRNIWRGYLLVKYNNKSAPFLLLSTTTVRHSIKALHLIKKLPRFKLTKGRKRCEVCVESADKLSSQTSPAYLKMATITIRSTLRLRICTCACVNVHVIYCLLCCVRTNA